MAPTEGSVRARAHVRPGRQRPGIGLSPLRSIGTSANLPTATTPLVGRESEVRELRAKCTDPQVRLLTLTGPGGTGKTRPAVGIAQTLEHAFPGGVFFADLSAAMRDATMWLAVADALNAFVGSAPAGSGRPVPNQRGSRARSPRKP